MPPQALHRRHFLACSLLAGSAVAAGATGRSWAAAAPIAMPLAVRTEQGIVAGARDQAAMAWKGIPFAQPPVGRLRGRAPQPPLRRAGTLDCRAFGAQAMQTAIGPHADPAKISGSEDCLYLNVWTPMTRSPAPLPVIVWIHGGGFVGGSASEPAYAGDRYAADGRLVFVSINYRLNGFGYLWNPNEPGSANLGLLDQMAALRWIKRNIAALGGDPGNVTVMGESAGAMSIGHLMGMPLAAGLFDKAITQSGATSHLYSHGEHEEVAARVLHEAGVGPRDYDALYLLDSSTLEGAFMRAWFKMQGTPLAGMAAFHGSVDGVVMKQHPLRAIRPMPTVIAHCKAEVATFNGGTHVDDSHDQLSAKSEALAGAAPWAAIKSTYITSRTGADPTIELYSAAFCVDASLRLADAVTAAGGKAWSYRFDYDKAAPFGAGHATDVPFTFYRGEGEAMRQGMGPPELWTDEARKVGRTVWGLAVAFAHDGRPSGSTLPAWPVHDATIPYMSIDATNALQHDFLGADRRKAWSTLAPEQMI